MAAEEAADPLVPEILSLEAEGFVVVPLAVVVFDAESGRFYVNYAHIRLDGLHLKIFLNYALRQLKCTKSRDSFLYK